ncbi:MAG: hypothetical protein QXM52_03190, partial [Candidatus Bathyarchaeia archaeon]
TSTLGDDRVAASSGEAMFRKNCAPNGSGVAVGTGVAVGAGVRVGVEVGAIFRATNVGVAVGAMGLVEALDGWDVCEGVAVGADVSGWVADRITIGDVCAGVGVDAGVCWAECIDVWPSCSCGAGLASITGSGLAC